MNDIRRKCFVLYMDKLNNILPDLSNEEAGELLKSMYYYNINNSLPESISKTVKVAVSSFLLDFDRDFERYKAKVSNISLQQKTSLKWSKMQLCDKIAAVKREFNCQVPNLMITEFLSYEFSVITDWFSGKYHPKNWLFLTGFSGTGKTVLAKSICFAYNKINNSLINSNNKKENWVFKNPIDIIEVVVGQKNNDIYQSIQNANKLCIDNLGIEPNDQYIYGNKRNIMKEILLNRYEKNLPTIITSTLGIDDKNKSQIEKKYGTMIYNRIIEKSVIIKFDTNALKYLQNK